MQTIQQLFDYARLADAAYINLLDVAWLNNPDAVVNDAVAEGRLPRRLAEATFNTAPNGWQVAGYDDSRNAIDGFAATLFKSTEGKYVLAMRGTEDSAGQTTIDLWKSDIKEIGYIGLALSQTVSMVNLMLRLQGTQGATNVLQFDLRTSTASTAPAIGPNAIGAPLGQAGAWFWLEPRNDGQGLGALPAGAKIDVTGHSLGGHLAGLATRLLPQLVNEAVIFNAPGFDPATAGQVAAAASGTPLGALFGVLPPAQQLTDEAMDMFRRYMPSVGDWIGNVTSLESEDLAPGAETDLISSLVTGTSFGPEANVSVEMKSHGMGQIVDSLAMQSALAKLDASLTLGSFEQFFLASSTTDRSAMENFVVALQRQLANPLAPSDLPISEAGTGLLPYISSGDFQARSAWYERWKAIEASAAYQSLVGKVTVKPAAGDTSLHTRAHTDFSTLLALLTLSPVVLAAKTTADAPAVEAALSGTWSSAYTDWQADNALVAQGKPAERLTDTYLADRQAMLQWLMVRNLTNTAGVITGGIAGAPVGQAANYEDKTTATQILVGATDLMNQRVQVMFGADAGDTLDGFGRNDHLYGGAGTDTLNGLGGADWLEGNADDDTLDGGAGNDTLLGGTGSDTYNFTGAFGHDTVIDADGLGTITVEGYGTLLGAAAGRLTSGSWKGDDPRVSYTLVSSAGRQDLLIRFTDQPERSITIRGWSGNAPAQTPVPSLGMSLANVDAPAPATVYTLVGTAGDDNVPSSLPSANLSGLAGNDALRMPYAIPPLDYYGWTLDQTHGVLDGGAGDDLFLGGDGADIMRGGDGNDSLYGGIRPFDSWSSGLTWSNFWGMSATDTRPFIDQYYPQLRRDADANVIDAGAGLDSVAGGWGDDVIDGGADADVLFGLAGDDIIQGGTGDDALRGDGATRYLVSAAFYDAQGTYHTEVISPTYAPVWLHGRDVLDGGDGDDILAGDGNDDELYGGDGNDTLNGDARGLDDVADDLLELPLAARGNDWLDGGAGNDKLIGDAGNDTLYGGTGSDTYTFNDEFSRDGIIDADGSGRIQRNGADLPQGLKVFDGLWQSADRKVTYTQITNEAGDPNDPNGPRHDLVISFADSTKRIVVRGWNPDSRSLGISFGANFAKPVTTQNYIGNFTKKIIGMGAAQRYEMLGDNYVADVDAGPQPGAADQIVGLAGNEAFYGLGGDDATLGRAGDDYIDGGDVLQGAMHAARWKVCSRGRALGAAPTRSVA